MKKIMLEDKDIKLSIFSDCNNYKRSYTGANTLTWPMAV
jgi:hypothetical protein